MSMNFEPSYQDNGWESEIKFDSIARTESKT